jgi:hypothetical protein
MAWRRLRLEGLLKQVCLWHFSDVASVVSDVRSAGAKQALRLRTSGSEFETQFGHEEM